MSWLNQLSAVTDRNLVPNWYLLSGEGLVQAGKTLYWGTLSTNCTLLCIWTPKLGREDTLSLLYVGAHQSKFANIIDHGEDQDL